MINEYDDLIATLRDVALSTNLPLKQQNGKWTITDRKAIWKSIGPKISDAYLRRLDPIAIEVLKEIDPQFDLEPSERYAASIHKKVLKHSPKLRNGIAETLALTGSFPEALTSCSTGFPEAVVRSIVRSVLFNAEWNIWASLNDCLPDLAEAAPEEYLNAIETALHTSPCPFVDVFKQESGGIGGRIYTTGLLRGLECLAWSSDYLIRVTIALGNLAAIDPGGNWANRPINSLVHIFLPWHPQTVVEPSKRIAAIQTLLREQPGVGWTLLLKLLPNETRTSSGSTKPSWRQFIPDNWTDEVNKQEYWQQAVEYSSLTVELAKQEFSKLTELIPQIPNLARPSADALCDYLNSLNVLEIPDEVRFPPWDALMALIVQHRRFPSADWVLPTEFIERLENIAEKMAPRSHYLIARRLFINNDWDLVESRNDEEQAETLTVKRKEVVGSIYKSDGMTGIKELAKQVQSPRKLGVICGLILPDSEDARLLSEGLNEEEPLQKDFARGFAEGKFSIKGWQWVDELLNLSWTQGQRAELLLNMPFGRDSWQRADAILDQGADSYWRRVPVYHMKDTNELMEAAEKLLMHKRPQAALECLGWLRYYKAKFPPQLAVQALLNRLSSDEPTSSHDQYQIEELIRWLQSQSVNEDDMVAIEWNYLPLLGRLEGGVPITLSRVLATNPKFFTQVVQAIFKSDKETSNEPTENERKVAQNAYRLLNEWKVVPGTNSEGSFNGDMFRDWLSKVKELSKQSGHLSAAMKMIGHVLPYAPADPNGLWIDMAVAEALNAMDANEMRSGFINQLFNMRGVHSFSAGNEERDLAKQFFQKAEALDNKSFQRVAAAVRDLGKAYQIDSEREAKRNMFDD